MVPDLESQQPSQADVPPELRSDPYAGEKLDKKLKAEGKDLPTTGNQAGYSCVSTTTCFDACSATAD